MARDLPPMDPELSATLEEIPDEFLLANVVDFDDLPATRERMTELLETMLAEMPDRPDVESEDLTVPGPTAERDLPLRIYRPVDAGTDTDDPLPCLYWIHGGGMVLGDLDQDDPTCERLADEVGCVVVSVDYRLAPEHPYPAPVDDCFAGLEWVTANAADLGVDPSRVAIGGQSAGGGLSAAVALRARDGDGPELCHQHLIYPMLDDRNDTESSRQVTDVGIWDRGMNLRAWEAYLGELSGADDLPPYAAPGRVDDLSGLPPTYLDIGTHDVFRDETRAYAERLLGNGVETEFHLWPGAYHAYETFAPEARLSRETWEARANALDRAFDAE
ncbi:alpha/beta hydrolase [Halorubrum sp. 48-1-W]|uniref:alpha/beta hydrolase n=1 Tax=Halorubrum sp. 48-1-W TaxID=2249761 RepID=UPI000DCB0DC2|nr:alpha/beta hydrolase [Halorubrum sp. 48-1-W]RAW46164.1 alpha/beta hydrolase [Halorubrum sp. 48-1-W]